MPIRTKRYGLVAFGEKGDQYINAADYIRTRVLENLLSSCLSIVGSGVIRGLNVTKKDEYIRGGLPVNNEVIVSEGLAIAPYEFQQQIPQSDNTIQIPTLTAYVGLKSPSLATLTISHTNGIVGIYISAKNLDANPTLHGFDQLANPIRNTTTDISSRDAYMVYEIDGEIQVDYNIIVFVNSKKLYENIHYTTAGNKIIFKAKRTPSDVVSVQLEPQNSVPLALVTIANGSIVNVDTSIKMSVLQKMEDDTISSQLKDHEHAGTTGSPSKITLTTTTNYTLTESVPNTLRTVYRVHKTPVYLSDNVTIDPDIPYLMNKTAVESNKMKSFFGTSKNVDVNFLEDSDNAQDNFNNGFATNADNLKGYIVNPNTSQKQISYVISNTSSKIYCSSDIDSISTTGDNYLIMPYETRIKVNGKEEYYGYRVSLDDNSIIEITFDNSLDATDVVELKLYFVTSVHEVIGKCDIENINFGGPSISSGTINPNLIPDLIHYGRKNEPLFPITDPAFLEQIAITDPSVVGSVWDMDTLDLTDYRPRNPYVGSFRAITDICKAGGRFYACSNNTILRSDISDRLFDTLGWEEDNVPDSLAPFKMVKVAAGELEYIYALNDKFIYANYPSGEDNTVRNKWKIFTGLNATQIQGDTDILTSMYTVSNAVPSHIYDIAADNNGNLYAATDVGLYCYNASGNGPTKNWSIVIADQECTSVRVIDSVDGYSVLVGIKKSESTTAFWYSLLAPNLITSSASRGSNYIYVDDASVFSATSGKNDITIYSSPSGAAPQKATVTAIVGNKITFTPSLTSDVVGNISYAIRSFKKSALVTMSIPRSIYLDKTNNIVINNSSTLEKYAFDFSTEIMSTVGSSLSAPANGYIYSYASVFGDPDNDYSGCLDYCCVKDSSTNAVGGVYLNIIANPTPLTKLNNTAFYKTITNPVENAAAPLLEPNFIYEDEDNEDFYIGCSTGIFQCSTQDATSATKEVIIRNAMNYLGRPLDAQNNALKNRSAFGYLGIKADTGGTYDVYTGERTLKVICDLAGSSVGDHLLFTNEGGGPRVGKYFRILEITAIDAVNKKYSIKVDPLNGEPFTISSFKYGETFDVIPSLSPLPVINDVPQSDFFTLSNNPSTYSFPLQTVTFTYPCNYWDNVTVATSFKYFVPKYGNWGRTNDSNVRFNGRIISTISGEVSSVRVDDNSISGTTAYSTIVYAQNAIFSGLKLAGKSVKITKLLTDETYQYITYTIQDNNESSFSISGNVISDITSNTSSVSDISFELHLSSSVGYTTNPTQYSYISLASQVSTQDAMTIDIKDTYIQNAGIFDHIGIEDNLSEEETGLSYGLDGVRNSNFLQAALSIKDFIYSIPSTYGENIEFIDFSEDNVIDLLNSNFANSQLCESTSTVGEVAFNIFGLLYSQRYGGLFALTESGVFFKPDATVYNSTPTWRYLNKLLDTLNPVGFPVIDSSNPAGFYIGYDSDTQKWTISWGGFKTGSLRNNNLSIIEYVSCKLDRQDDDTFYVATSNQGIFKTEDAGDNFVSIFDKSCFYDIPKNKTKSFCLHPLRNFSSYILTESSLYRSYDRGSNYDLTYIRIWPESAIPDVDIRSELLAINAARKNIFSKVINNSSTVDQSYTFFGGDSLFVHGPYDGVVGGEGGWDEELMIKSNNGSQPIFNKIGIKDLSFSDETDLEVYDVDICPTNENYVALATNMGVFRSYSGIVSGVNAESKHQIVYDPQNLVIDNSHFIQIQVSGSIPSYALPAGAFVLLDSGNSNFAGEVVSAAIESDDAYEYITTIIVKGRLVSSNGYPVTKKYSYITIKKWVPATKNANFTPSCVTHPTTSIIYCGTVEGGMFKLESDVWTQINDGFNTFGEEENITISQVSRVGSAIYASVKSTTATSGGLYQFNAPLVQWDLLLEGNVSCFDVCGTRIICATDEAIKYSVNTGGAWTDAYLPFMNINRMSWGSEAEGDIWAGTTGAGVIKGINYGSAWNQSFEYNEAAKSIRSNCFRIVGISKNNDDTLNIETKSNAKDIFKTSSNATKYSQEVEITGEFEWANPTSSTLKSGDVAWNDLSIYPFLTKQSVRSSLGNEVPQNATIVNKTVQNPSSMDIVIDAISDHASGVSPKNFTDNQSKIPNRQGGGRIYNGVAPSSINNCPYVEPVGLPAQSPRTFGVKCIAYDTKDAPSSKTTYFAGTENKGLIKVETIPTFRYIAGYGTIEEISGVLYLIDRNRGDVSGGPLPSTGTNTFDATLADTNHYCSLRNTQGTETYTFTITGYSAPLEALIIEPIDPIIIPSGTIGGYVISNLETTSINGVTEFTQDTDLGLYLDEAITSPYVPVLDGPIYDKIVLTTTASAIADITVFNNAKLFYAPFSKPFNNTSPMYGGEIAFTIHEASSYDGATFEAYVETVDITFDTGNAYANIKQIVNNYGMTQITLDTRVSVEDLGSLLNLRLIFEGDNPIYYCILDHVLRQEQDILYIVDEDQSLYADLISRAPATVRINFSPACLKIYGESATTKSYALPAYIEPVSTMTALNGDITYDELYQYTNEYGEIKPSIDSIVVTPTHIFAAANPVGFMSFARGLSDATGIWSKVTGEWPNIISIESNVDGDMIVVCENKIFVSSYDSGEPLGLGAITEDTPSLLTGFIEWGKIDADSSIYVGTSEGVIWRKKTGEPAYSKINEGVESSSCPQWKFVKDENDLQNIYTYGLKAGVFKYDYDNKTFTNVGGSIANKNICDMAVSGNTVYALSFGGKIYKSTDGATSWESITSPSHNTLIKNISIFPDAPYVIIALSYKNVIRTDYGDYASYDRGETKVYISSDAGNTWEEISYISITYSYEEQADIEIALSSCIKCFNGGICFVGLPNQHVYKTSDYGVNFAVIDYDADFQEVIDIASTSNKTNEFFILATLNNQRCLLLSTDSGVTWSLKYINGIPLNYSSINPFSYGTTFSITCPYASGNFGLVGQIMAWDNFSLTNQHIVAHTLVESFSNSTYISVPDLVYFDLGTSDSSTYVRFYDSSSVRNPALEDYLGKTYKGWYPIGLQNNSLEPNKIPIPLLYDVKELNQNGVFEIYGLTKVTLDITGTEFSDLFGQQGSLVNLYMQIGVNTAYKIAGHYLVDSNTAVVYLAGKYAADFSGTDTISIGPLSGTSIAPLTYFITSNNEGAAGANTIACSVNYLDRNIVYDGSIKLKYNNNNDYISVMDHKWASVYIDSNDNVMGFRNAFCVIADFLTPLNNHPTAALETAGSVSLFPMDNGVSMFVENSTLVSYVTTKTGVYKSVDPEPTTHLDSDVSNYVKNLSSYINVAGVASTFSTIDYPLTVSSYFKNAGFMIADGKILYTDSLSSWSDVSSPWLEKNYPSSIKKFSPSWVKAIVPLPLADHYAFMLLNDSSAATNPYNGLYYTDNGAVSWTKIVINSENTSLGALGACSNGTDKLFLATKNGSNYDIYSNCVGTLGNDISFTEPLDSSNLLIGTPYGLTHISTTRKSSDHFTSIVDKESAAFTACANTSRRILAYADNEKLFVFATSTVVAKDGGLEAGLLGTISTTGAVINKIYYNSGKIYLCTSKGVYFIEETDLDTRLAASTALNLQSFSYMDKALASNATCINVDAYGTTWIGYETDGVLKIASTGAVRAYNNSNSPMTSNKINDVISIPKATCIISSGTASFTIPSSLASDQIIVVKVSGGNAPFSPRDNVSYVTPSQVLVTSSSYVSSTNTSTLVFSGADLSSMVSTTIQKCLLVKNATTNAIAEYVIISVDNTASSIVISGNTGTTTTSFYATVCQKPDSSNYVSYYGANATVTDSMLENGVLYSYGVYYRDSSKEYYPAFNFSFVYSTGLNHTISLDNVFFLTDGNLYSYDQGNDGITSELSTGINDVFGNMCIDGRYSLYISYRNSAKFRPYNNINKHQSPYNNSFTTCNGISCKDNAIYLSSNIGVYTWNNTITYYLQLSQDVITSSWITKTTISSKNLFSKILSIPSKDTLVGISWDDIGSNLIYVFDKAVCISSSQEFGLSSIPVSLASNDSIVCFYASSTLNGNTYSMLSLGTKYDVLIYSPDYNIDSLSGINIVNSDQETIDYLNSAIGSWVFDGATLLISTLGSGYEYRRPRGQFIGFFNAVSPFFTNFLSSGSTTIFDPLSDIADNIGIYFNSHFGISYEPSLDFATIMSRDSLGYELTSTKNGLYYRKQVSVGETENAWSLVDLTCYSDEFTQYYPVSIHACNHLRNAQGALVTILASSSPAYFFESPELLGNNTKVFKYFVIYIDISHLDGPPESYTVIKQIVSRGSFDEKDMQDLASKYFDNYITYTSYEYDSLIKKRYKVLDAPKSVLSGAGFIDDTIYPNVLSANSYGQIERIYATVESSFDVPYYHQSDFGCKLHDSSNTLNSQHGRNKTKVYEGLKYYRPYRGVEAAFDPNDTKVIYLALFNPSETLSDFDSSVSAANPSQDFCQLLKTVDGGQNWFEINIDNSLPSSAKINKIVIDPTNSQTLYLATSGNVSKVGETYVSDNGIYTSDDGGLTFRDISSNMPKYPVKTLLLDDDKITGGQLYAGTLGKGVYTRNLFDYGYGYGQINYSYNYGVSSYYGYGYGYEIEGTGGADFFDAFLQDPDDNAWTIVQPKVFQRDGIGLTNGNVVDVVTNPSNDKIYALSQKHGLIKSMDGGRRWTYEDTALNLEYDFTALYVSPYYDDLIMLGTEDGLYARNTSSQSWQRISQFEGIRINRIVGNDHYNRNLVNFTIYKPPTVTSDSFMVVKRENSVARVPAGIKYSDRVVGDTVGDGTIAYLGSFGGNTSYDFYDHHNVKDGIDYYYSLFYDLDGLMYPFPDLYTNEINSYSSADNTITIAPYSGFVSSYEYDSGDGITYVDDDVVLTALEASEWDKGFGSHLVGRSVTFSKDGQADYTTTITYANYASFGVTGDHETEVAGRSYVIDVEMDSNQYAGYIVNPSVDQLILVHSMGKPITYVITENDQYTITFGLEQNQPPLDNVAGVAPPMVGEFEFRTGTTFAVTSTVKAKARKAEMVYVLTDAGLYYTLDNGIVFTKTDTVNNDVFFIDFAPESVDNNGSLKAWAATDNGLFYTTNGFDTCDATYGYSSGEYRYVKIDDNDSSVVYAYKQSSGLWKSLDGGITFTQMILEYEINTIMSSHDLNDAIYRNSYTNNILLSMAQQGVIYVKDSVRDYFNINLETDYGFQDIVCDNFKITDSISCDVNSINIVSQVRPTGDDDVNSVSFYANDGNYITSNVSHQSMKMDAENIYIGEAKEHPLNVPFRLRLPESYTMPSLMGFSINEMYDGSICIGTNRGGYISKDGTIFSKIDNFLIPDLIFSINKLRDGHTYLGTPNGAWINTDDSLQNFIPKYKIGSIITCFWSYRDGERYTMFMGGKDGLTIKYRNYPYLTVTTPNNFNPQDGIQFSWGEEQDDGSISPGGIDPAMLDKLNMHKMIMNWQTGTEEDKTGWAGTVIVRVEDSSPNGFIPMNAVNYEKGDRRYVDAIRINKFDTTPETEIQATSVVVPFPTGMTIVDNISAVKDREETGYTRTKLEILKLQDTSLANALPDTFTVEEPYKDITHVTVASTVGFDYNDYLDYGAYDATVNPLPEGAMLKPSTTYTYTMFAYYNRPSNFVYQSGYSSMRVYSPVKTKEFNYFIPISQMPNATVILCGAALNEYVYFVGTDDGLFYTKENIGLTKAGGTDGMKVNSILIADDTLSYFYGYGYGYSQYVDSVDYFDIFNETGYGYGYSEYGPSAYYGYGYTQGYELEASKLIFAATSEGVIMSLDGGENFTLIFSSDYYEFNYAMCLAQDNDGSILVGTDRGIFKKDPNIHTLWSFYSIVGAADSAPLGKIIGQSVKLP